MRPGAPLYVQVALPISVQASYDGVVHARSTSDPEGLYLHLRTGTGPPVVLRTAVDPEAHARLGDATSQEELTLAAAAGDDVVVSLLSDFHKSVSLRVVDEGCVCAGEGPCCDGCRPRAVGYPCDDGLACTLDDRCVVGICSGVPLICDDFDVCTDDACEEPDGTCSFVQYTAPCDDGVYCTVEDACLEGTCAGLPRDCGYVVSSEECAVARCSEAAAACVADPIREGEPCDAASFCRLHGQCIAGECRSAPRNCGGAVEEPQCQTPACDEGADACTAQPTREGEACEDGLFCTVDGACDGGLCPSSPRDCAGATAPSSTTATPASWSPATRTQAAGRMSWRMAPSVRQATSAAAAGAGTAHPRRATPPVPRPQRMKASRPGARWPARTREAAARRSTLPARRLVACSSCCAWLVLLRRRRAPGGAGELL